MGIVAPNRLPHSQGRAQYLYRNCQCPFPLEVVPEHILSPAEQSDCYLAAPEIMTS